MTTALSRRPRAFQLQVPGSWLEFDVWRATRTGDLARLVDRRLQETPELRPRRGELLRALRGAAADAERQGAVFCAAMLDPVEDAGLLAGLVMVFHTPGSPDPRANTAEAIAGQVTAETPADGSPTWRSVAFVDLHAGRAVRVQGVESEPSGPHGVVMQTLIPVPGDDGVLNVVLTSPQVALAEPLLDLFAAISSTLAWTDQVEA